jgi:hypothetical protein
VPPAHASINVRAWLRDWERANACHASQDGARGGGLIPQWLRARLFSKQTLTRRHPEPQPGEPTEHDLFAGVTDDN